MRATLDNAARAGFGRLVHAERRELADLPPAPAPRGLVVVNPPYGERIGEVTELAETYALLGRKLRETFLGWQAAVFTGNPPLGRELGLKARRTHTMYNGPIECRLLRIDIDAKYFETKRVPGALPALNEAARARPGADMFANRLRKNASAAWRLGAPRRHRLLPRVRRRHAGVRVLDRRLCGCALTRLRSVGSTCRSTRRRRRSIPPKPARGAKRRSR